MEDEIRFTADEARIANRIRAIDRELDEVERRAQDSVAQGLKGGGWGLAASAAKQVQADADQRHRDLLDERALLAAQLRSRIERDAE